MMDNYVWVTGRDGETYEICPTDGLLRFLQRLAAGEAAEQEAMMGEYSLEYRPAEETCIDYQN